VKELHEDRIDQERMGAIGFGKYRPVAPNAAGNRGNTLNRRVEIWIVPSALLRRAPAASQPTTAPAGPAASS
jgi:hypothetical protein